ncbi:YfiR family protein [Oceanicoccus sp. KOV_DT_Chl]|uniref:YfiR family protein n=1 Tax=Oceanicoccus sp. KOV_DT_Chl TaxID=1904639 RepID=UPI001359B324|nr:YfiR family protein [Oceanicoccus sp. KOV_DT_Chl]
MLTIAEENFAREYKIKAAYLYNLIKFINWPASHTPEAATNICIVGNNPFDTYLDKLTTRTAKGLPINVRLLATTDEINNCHITFFSHKAGSNPKLIDRASRYPQLLVGENMQFLDNGGLISLVVVDNNVQLQINLTRAKATGFEISGNLLEIAKIVK